MEETQFGESSYSKEAPPSMRHLVLPEIRAQWERLSLGRETVAPAEVRRLLKRLGLPLHKEGGREYIEGADALLAPYEQGAERFDVRACSMVPPLRPFPALRFRSLSQLFHKGKQQSDTFTIRFSFRLSSINIT